MYRGAHVQSARTRECLKRSNICREICSEAIAYCLEQKRDLPDMALISALLQCIKFCKMNADFMVRQGYVHNRVRMLCREQCLQTAKTCGRYNDPILEAAALASEECALSCVALEECISSK